MLAKQRILGSDSRSLNQIADQSVDLVVTSPPYPMIEMWDTVFSSLSNEVKTALATEDGNGAFKAMHGELNKVWVELYRVLKEGAFACINIGDATRTIGDRFQLYPNHAKIIESFQGLGFYCLPTILWRKQTNAPNKFMGSGMLPAGAYVTLEHEYILIFRKENKRKFRNEQERLSRMKSSFFWEERNKWFSDVWDFKGTAQDITDPNLRTRSGAYPVELAYRLINMYSLYEDTILDPFLGTGSTTLASIACGRNSIGIEIEPAFLPVINKKINSFKIPSNELLFDRITTHNKFVSTYSTEKGPLKYRNIPHGFPVMTRQEIEMRLFQVTGITAPDDGTAEVSYQLLGALDTSRAIASYTRVKNETPSQQLVMNL